MRVLLAAVVLSAAPLSTTTGCTPRADDGAERLTFADGSEALRWGDGEYGVVLVTGEGEEARDWGPLAKEISANRMTALAVDTTDATAARLAAAADWMAAQGIKRIAYLASGRHGADLLVQHVRAGGVIDQLILISGRLTDPELAELREPPKLFAAAENELVGSEVAAHMAEVAAGTWNALLLVPGEDYGLAILDGMGAEELIASVVARLEERR